MSSKSDIVSNLQQKLSYLSSGDARIAMDSVIEDMSQALIAGDRIEIRGFASFSTRQRKYAGKDEFYNTVYFRMSKKVFNELNPGLIDT